MPYSATPTDDAGRPQVRDRFLTFAFAAADLLVEADPHGIIGFAAGAFMTRLGVVPETFLHRHVSDLVASVDQPAMAVALATAAARGRSPPALVRLADPGQTVVSMSMLLVPGPLSRLCVTFATPPAAPGDAAAGASPMAEGSRPLLAAASQWLRGQAPQSGRVRLLEVTGWADAKRNMSAAAQEALRLEIAAALAAAAPGALSSEIAEGRFGVVGTGDLDLQGVVGQLERLLRGSAALRSAPVAETHIALESGLAPAQAAQALRFALASFAERGTEGTLAAGGASGLAGIMALAETRAVGLRRAIANRQFELRYQPVTSLAERRIHHFEALLRPCGATLGGYGSTQEFVAFAELVGLVEELDAAVLSDVMGALRASPAVRVAINVSGQSIQSSGFLARALALVEQAGLRDRLMMEVTETVEIRDIQAAAIHMAQLRAAGVALCLDDFGAGAASFRYLRELPVDFVKIDGSFVRQAPASPRERRFVASIVDLAASANARTIAEMIETEEQAALMLSLGVEFGQGWLLGRPGRLPRPTA